MSDQPGTFETIARHLALAVSPLRTAVADLAAFKRFMYRMGWDIQSLPPAYSALASLVDEIADALSLPKVVYGWGESSLDTVTLFGHLREVIGHTGALVSFGLAPTDLVEGYMDAGAPRSSLKLTLLETSVADKPVELAFVL